MSTKKKIKVIAFMEEGLLNQVYTDGDVDLIVVNYDTDGAAEADLAKFTCMSGAKAEAYVRREQPVEKDKGVVNHYWKQLEEFARRQKEKYDELVTKINAESVKP